jgi:glycine betaine/choline ABC-type transport system substrate-binding protein
LGEFLAQHIENRTQLNVDRRLNLGGTFLCDAAVKAGQIDGYVEYTDTVLTAILKQSLQSNPKTVYQTVKKAYDRQFSLAVLSPLGFQNTFAMVVRGEEARQYGVRTLSQAAKYTPGWKAIVGYEFLEREDGFSGLAKTYGLTFKQPPEVMDLGLMYRALIEKKVDLISGNSTDGLIQKFNLAIIKDDRRSFPPYETVSVFTRSVLEKYPRVRTAIEKLSGKISAADMQRLNHEADAEFRSPETVVRDFSQDLT